MDVHPGTSRQRQLTFTAVAALLVTAAPALPAVLDFEGLPAGTVVAGERPDGGFEPGTFFSGVSIEATSGSGGPDAVVIFDSSAPTGDDRDLGTPNWTCGGPGLGVGGESGGPGENCVALGNILVIAENIADLSPTDGLVDDPDDEAMGGTVDFLFDDPVLPESIVILDIDDESAHVSLYLHDNHLSTISADDRGDNSAQTIDLSAWGSVDRVEVFFSSSGGVGELRYEVPHTAVEDASWGGVKKLFR